MNPDPAPRRKILFLSFAYPAFGGAGTQLRARALLRMLGAHADVYLLIAGHVEKLGGPRDPAIEALCRKIVYLRVLPTETGGVWPRLNAEVGPLDLPVIDCQPSEAAARVEEFYREHALDLLFVFRFEALFFVYQRLDRFPLRYLDLDELGSRRMGQIQALSAQSAFEPMPAREKSFNAAALIMEKVFLRRFQRVFVSSAHEAEQVRLRTGFAASQVLPNSYPVPAHSLAEKPPSARAELFFVGSLSYFPNTDAILYFCREILPLIRKKRGDAVLFRIAGMGRTAALECIRGLPGIDLAGYQENLEPFYLHADAVVVPLRAGAGTRFKILEAFALGRPVVSTTIGAEGLAVTHRRHLLLADTPGDFAAACLEIMEHPERFQEMRAAAARLCRELYSEEALLRSYQEITAAPPAPIA